MASFGERMAKCKFSNRAQGEGSGVLLLPADASTVQYIHTKINTYLQIKHINVPLHKISVLYLPSHEIRNTIICEFEV